MKTIEKILTVLTKNLGLTIMLVLSIVLFAIFSDGLIRGIITAASAFMAYVSIVLLYKEYKHKSAPHSTPKKKRNKK